MLCVNMYQHEGGEANGGSGQADQATQRNHDGAKHSETDHNDARCLPCLVGFCCFSTGFLWLKTAWGNGK